MNHKHINKVGRLIVDSLLLLLLGAILALPASTFSLLKYMPNENNVLSERHVRPEPVINPEDPTKTVREDYLPAEESTPSNSLAPSTQ